MELSDLVGEHELTGVDFGTHDVDDYGHPRPANDIAFVLDGTVYRVTEDDDDGYRSSMKDIEVVTDLVVKNTFAPVKVLARMGSEGHYGECDILQCVDVVTGKIVLEVGTESVDDYYPGYVANFTPEHMAINQPASDPAVPNRDA